MTRVNVKNSLTVSFCFLLSLVCLYITNLREEEKYKIDISNNYKLVVQENNGRTRDMHHEITSTSELMAVSKRISDKHGFVFLLFLNEAYLEMTKSWICNIQALVPEILSRIVFITTSNALSSKLLSWNDQVYVAAHFFPISGDVSYGQYSYFRLTAERLSIQNAMIQSGVNIMIIESDATWYSGKVVDIIEERFKEYDIISASDDIKNGHHVVCACFLGVRSTRTTRQFFRFYNETYFNTIEKHKNSKKYLGDLAEQHTMSEMLRKRSDIRVYWMTQCEYANGKWYKQQPDPKCPYPMIVHNNYIIGNSAKMQRLKEYGQWYINDEEQCRVFPEWD